MAAALSNLNTLFLDSEQEKYACCFLDRVNSKQEFNAEVLKALNLARNGTLKNFYDKNQRENTTFRPDFGHCQVNDVTFKKRAAGVYYRVLLFNFHTLYEFRFSDWLICTT